MRSLPALLILLSACGGPFAEARREGTSLAYAAFVANHPDHPKAGRAAARAESLDWEAAASADTADAYSLYVVTHPTGPHVAEARERAEARSWEAASATGTREALADYLASFPMGAHRGQVDALMEDAWIGEARADDSVDSWGRYLFRYPEGRYVEEARSRRDTLAWEIAVKENRKVSYERYLRENPRGSHRTEARTWLSALAVHTLQPLVLVGPTWRPERGRAADLKRLQSELDRALLNGLKRDFTLLPTVVQASDGLVADPRERVAVDGEGVGWLVVTVAENVGKRFEPSGHATELPTTVEVWMATTDEPLFRWEATPATPSTVRGVTVESLYTEAVQEWGATLRGCILPAERLREPEIP